MTTSRRYSRVPITEAIIAFQADLPESVGLSDLERCQDAAYPAKKALADPEAGYLFASADEKQLFQVRLDGCTLHRLAPYEGWQAFRDEARRCWDLYRQTARPRKITRLVPRPD